LRRFKSGDHVNGQEGAWCVTHMTKASAIFPGVTSCPTDWDSNIATTWSPVTGQRVILSHCDRMDLKLQILI